MPRGGKRQGAGRKPLKRSERWLGGNAGKRNLSLVSASPESPRSEGSPVVAVPASPAVLTEDESAYWALWAPMATNRGLLNEDTKPGFVLLCQQARRAALLWSDIESMGRVLETVTVDGSGQEHRSYKAHPLMGHWRALMARVEQLQARYGIAADGKISEPAATEDDERAELAQLLSIS